MRSLKAGCLVLVLAAICSSVPQLAWARPSTTTSPTTPAPAAPTPDPVADCPAGLVCYTLAEEAAAQTAEEAKQHHLEAIEAELARMKWRRRVGFFAEGRYGGTVNGPSLGAVIVGAHIGWFWAGVGVYEYGSGLEAGGEVGFRYSW